MSDVPEKQLLPPIDIALIERQMRERDSMIWSRVGMKLAAGIPLSLAGPFVVALVLSLEGYILGWQFNYFTLWFILACGIWAVAAWKLLPRAPGGGRFANEMMRFVSVTPEQAPDLSFSDLSGREPREALRFILKTVLAGPQRLYEAWQVIQEYRTFGECRRQRAAQALQDLSRQPKGIPWSDLRQENETLPDLLAILGYLKAADWVDLSSDGTRIWMLSDARKATVTPILK